MVFIDEVSSKNQVTTRLSEKAMTQQFLKDMEKEKAYFKVQVDASGKESEAKAKDVAKITNEVRVAEQGVKSSNDQTEQVQDEKAKLSQALAELEHNTVATPGAATYTKLLVLYIMNTDAWLDTSR